MLVIGGCCRAVIYPGVEERLDRDYEERHALDFSGFYNVYNVSYYHIRAPQLLRSCVLHLCGSR